MDFNQFMNARRRGCLLGALHQAYKTAPGQSVAPDILHLYLLAIGLRPTLHQVAVDLEWLADHHCVDITRIDGVIFAKIVRHGIEAACRRVTIAGLDVAELEG